MYFSEIQSNISGLDEYSRTAILLHSQGMLVENQGVRCPKPKSPTNIGHKVHPVPFNLSLSFLHEDGFQATASWNNLYVEKLLHIW